MAKTWILVADRSRARILAPSESNNGKLDEIADFVHPESSLKQGDTISDRPRHFEGRGTVLHSGEPETDFKHQTAVRFAREIAEHLNKARQENQFNGLHVIAAPLFLGVLRERFPAPLLQLVKQEIAKDYTRLKPDQIRKHLPVEL